MRSHDVERTYLVEHYRPGVEIGQLRLCVTRVREGLQALARHGSSTGFLCSVIVPDDEAFLVVLRAKSEQQVTEAFGRAGVTFDRISIAIAEIAPQTSPNPDQ